MAVSFDVIVIGAGAAGMMCAIGAGQRGRRVLLLEHNAEPGEKIRISGGGRCNFTNIGASVKNYVSANPKFAISALSRFTQHDFVAWVQRYGIDFHEKTLGQLFCDGSARQIIDMLKAEMEAAGVVLRCGVEIGAVSKTADGFSVTVSGETLTAAALVVACGGKSIPKMGASGLGYKIAEQFGLKLTETRPGLVPLTFDPALLAETKELAGVAVDVLVTCGKVKFREAMLFTHRGLSGPAILQISSYWREGMAIGVNMAPDMDVFETLRAARAENGRQDMVTVLATFLPRRLAQMLAGDGGRLGDMSDKALRRVADSVQNWQVKPTGSEGYRTAEVTLGGVDTRGLDAKTLEARDVPSLYFIGEVVDVTGWLGGYNFQWAWSSGWAAGQVV